MSIETVSESKSFGGIQGVYQHPSASTGTPMTFAVYVPEHEPGAKLPVLWWLSGLTCTHVNVMEKGEYRKACAEHGIVFVAPDTSPRGDEVPDDEAYDFGKGAGFYVDATRERRPLDGRPRRAHGQLAQSRPVPLDQRVRADRQPAQLPVGREGADRLFRG